MGNRLCPHSVRIAHHGGDWSLRGGSFPLIARGTASKAVKNLTLLRWQKPRKVTERQSLRVTFVVLFVLVIYFFAIVLFVFFVVWLFSNEDIGGK
jgi:hypothetical protein